MQSKDLRSLIESYNSIYDTPEETISEGEMEQAAQAEKYRRDAIHRERQRKAESERPKPKPQSKKPEPRLGYGAKGFKGGALESVETEAEMLEPYDIILGHLIDEGFASTVESAEKIMSVMSDEWMQSIVEQEKTAKFTVTDLDRKLNTPAYQRYKQGNPNYQGGGEGANKLKEA